MKRKKNKGKEFLTFSSIEQGGIFLTIIAFMFWLVFRGIVAFFLVTYMTEYFGLTFGRYGLFLGMCALGWTIYPILKYKVTMRLF